MRVAFFTDTFHPQVNGIVTSVANLSRELGRRGHEVMIFTPAPSRGSVEAHGVFAAPNVTVVPLRSVPLLLYPEFRVGVLFLDIVLRRIRAFAPDIVHVHTPLTVGIGGVLAAKLLGVPLVGTNHVYLTKDNIAFFESVYDSKMLQRIAARLTRGYMHTFYARCDLLLAPSRELISQMKNAGYRKRTEYLSNGIDMRALTLLTGADRETMKVKYGLAKRTVAHVGRLSHEKSVDVLLRAFARLAGSRKDLSLFIIGDGPAMPDLRGLAAELGIADRTVFAGMVDHQTLVGSGMLSLGDVFATASTMEAQGMVVLEAMCCGLPVVCAGEAGVSELVDGNGLLTPPDDPVRMAENIGRILDDDGLRATMGGRSLELAKQYSVEGVAEEVLEYYEGLLSA